MASSTVRIVGLGHDLCLQEALKEFWDHQTLCDVTFIFPSKSQHPATNVPQQREILKAHSSVLAAVSPVFKNILSSSLQSEEEIVVLVPEYPQRVFCLALNYIYNGGLRVDSTKFEIGQVLKLLSDFRVKVPDFCYVLLEDQSQRAQLSQGTSATHSVTKQQQILRSIVPQINFYSNKRTVAQYGNFTKRPSTNLNLPSQPQPKNLSNTSPALDYAVGLRKDAVSLPAPVVGSLNWFSPLPEKAFTVLSSLPKSVPNLQPTEDLGTTDNVGVYCESGTSAVSALIYRDEEPDPLPDSEPSCSSTPTKARFRNEGNPAALPVSTALSVRKPSLLASGLRSATSAKTSTKSAEQLIVEQKAMEREQRRHEKACRVLRSEQQHHRRLKKKISILTAKLDKYKCVAYKLLQPFNETLSDEEQDLEKKKTKPKAPPVLVECNICGKSVRKSHYSKHTATHKPSRSRNFLCEQCGRTFLSAPSLKAHRIRNHPSEDGKTHACPECGKIFKNNHCLTLHIKRHRGEKPYSCDVCQKNFVSVQNLKRHARVHTGERPYKCSICSKGFTQSTTLNQHMRVHKKYGDYQQFVVIDTAKDGRETFKCEYCSFVAGQLDNLLTHRMIHPEATPALRCLSCTEMFHAHQELREHVDAKHPELLHRCEICGEGYLTKLLLHGHRRKKHMEDIRTSNPKGASTSHPFTCRYCDRSFKALANMQVHERSAHTGERPYQCSVCGKTFCGIVGLNSHMEVHADRRPFKCSVCEKAFRTVFRLKCHLLIHTGERPHSCEICGKAFTMKSNLYMHRKIHTGTQHKCRVCNKILPSRVKLEKHEKTHET